MKRAVAIFFAGLCLSPLTHLEAKTVIPVPAALQTQLQALGAAKSTPYDVKQWITTIRKGEFANAAHMWPTIEASIDESQMPLAASHYVILAWNLGAERAALDALVAKLSQSRFLKSKEWAVLEPEMAKVLFNELPLLAPYFSSQQAQQLAQLKPGKPVNDVLRSWVASQQARYAPDNMELIPDETPWTALIATRVAYRQAQAGDPMAAVETLKTAMAKTKHLQAKAAGDEDPQLFESADFYHLQMGRLYYQAADLKSAASEYELVGKDSPEFLEAREELLWARLRSNDIAKLRGDIVSFEVTGIEERFIPELYVTRAISNLKLCRYDQAKADFQDFVTSNQAWAKKIETNLAASSAQRPPRVSLVTRVIEKSVPKLEREIKLIASLHEQSIKAGLPAAGKQSHWLQAKKQLQAELEGTKNRIATDYRVQWQSHSKQLYEAIRKMKFVKVELMSQLEQKQERGQQVASADEAKQDLHAATSDEKETNERTYPFDGVIWADEIFKLKSDANNQCL